MEKAITPVVHTWVRSQRGMIAGVCEGLGRKFNIEPWIIRLIWIASILLFGTGLLFYVILAFCLPRDDRLGEAFNPRFLGVCSNVAKETGIEVGLVRTAAVLIALGSFGTALVGYIILYFIVPNGAEPKAII